MTRSWIPATGAVLLTAVVVGGTNPAHALTTVAPEFLARSYQPDLIRQATGNDGLVVDVRARADTDAQDLAERTRTALQQSRLGRVMPLRVATDDATAHSTKLVIRFDPSVRTGYEDACAGRGTSAGHAVDKVMLTLCHEGVPVSSVTAQNTAATGVDRPAFADMLRQAATTLFPRRGGDLTGQGFWNTGLRN